MASLFRSRLAAAFSHAPSPIEHRYAFSVLSKTQSIQNNPHATRHYVTNEQTKQQDAPNKHEDAASPLASALYAPEKHHFIVEMVDEEFEAFLERTKNPVILDFYATWCDPCKSMGKLLTESVKAKNATILAAGDAHTAKDNAVILAKIDVDKCSRLQDKYQIPGIPYVTTHVHDSRGENEVLIGLKDTNTIDNFIERLVYKHNMK